MIRFRVLAWLGDIAAAFRGPRVQLARISRRLRGVLGEGAVSPKAKQEALPQFVRVIGLAARLGSEDLVRTVKDFEPSFVEFVVGDVPPLRTALAVIESSPSANTEALEAGLRLCRLTGDRVARQRLLERISLLLARAGDANGLLARLFQRHEEGALSRSDLESILATFLERHSFETSFPWSHFFRSLPESLLPPLHQVYAALGRHLEAANLAEAAGATKDAVSYLLVVPGTDVALRTLGLARKLSHPSTIVAANLKVADCLWVEGRFAAAASHFQDAGQPERASDCYQRLGQFAAAIRMRPAAQPEWLAEIRVEVDGTVRAHLAAARFVDAARLLHDVESALRARPDQPQQQSEAERASRLLADVVKTGRAALEAEVRATHAQPGAEVFKRWSVLEEAAGNFLEAALQAEMGHDHFTASLLFEKAGAFGQALSALGQTPEGAEPQRRAELLERGGDFFMAGLLYERMGEKNKAVAMFEGAEEYARAADLHRTLANETDLAFDDRWLELLTKAKRVDALADLCLSQARESARPEAEKVRLLLRVKELVERGLVGQKWMDQVAVGLPALEADSKASFAQRADEWASVAERAIQDTYLDAFGMDLGTSNSVVALFNRRTGQAEVVEWRGRPTFPSVFAVDHSGREIVGIPVSELLGSSPRAIVTRTKRWIGTDKSFKVDGKHFRPEEISARIIRHAQTTAKAHLRMRVAERLSALANKATGTTPPKDWVDAYLEDHPPKLSLNRAVITVPAYFNDAQKQATRTAATLADVAVMRLMHEPTAACLAQRAHEAREEMVLVVDLGAGTLDLSLIQVSAGVFEVTEIEGDNRAGGSDLDDVLLAHFVEAARKDTGSDSIHQGLAGRRLRQACEDMKIELSSHTSWTATLAHLVGAKTFELSLTRDDLERLAAPWLAQIQEVCRRIKGHPSRVLIIGGGSLMPAVRRCVAQVFGMEPRGGVDPLTAVARGAALQAAILSGELRELLVIDAVPFSLGIKSYVTRGKSKFDALIQKHTTIPTNSSSIYTTVENNQSIIKFEVFQGEDPEPAKNFKIGEFRLEGIPPVEAGVPQVEVTFAIDENCILRVTARDLGTRRERQIVIADSLLLAPAQVATLQRKLRDSQARQERLETLGKLAEGVSALCQEAVNADLASHQRRFEELTRQYETHMARYAPSDSDIRTLLELYRERADLNSRALLAVDRWGTLKKSADTWLAQLASADPRAERVDEQLDSMLTQGESLLARVREGTHLLGHCSATYRRWITVLQELPLNPEGSAEDLARHLLRLGRYVEALACYRRMGTVTSRGHVELGLEILARLRQRDDYMALLTERAELLGVTRPDFVRVNESVRAFSPSVVWIQQPDGTGSGFAVGPREIATNRHVITDSATGRVMPPEDVRVVSKNGSYRVASIHVPASSIDDVAILLLAEESHLAPLYLGFSELVEVGERIMTLGFPSPEAGGFEENLYCNTGLVNRIRPSELCTERVLEVSIELRGGISGAPILNELGGVVGLVTFAKMRAQALSGGHMHVEQSFYAIPVEVLRRLRVEMLNA